MIIEKYFSDIFSHYFFSLTNNRYYNGNNNIVAVIFLRQPLTEFSECAIMYSINTVKGKKDNMLRKFSVKNYKCFEEKIEIDFTKVNDYQFNSQCITSNNLLKDIIIFGANGVGKSNFGFALFDIVMTLTDRHVEPPQLDNASFLNFNTIEQYAEFEYEFEFNKSIVKYLYRKKSPRELTYEVLTVNNDLIYEISHSDKKNYVFYDYLGSSEGLMQNYKWDIPFQRYININVSWSDSAPVKSMMDFVDRMLWFRSLKDNAYIGLRTDIVVISQWLLDNNKVEDFQKFLKDIANLDLHFQVVDLGGPIKQRFLLQVGKNRGVIFDNVASTGTHALMVLYYWKQYLQDASFVFIDEFDAFYHFELSKNVVQMFMNMPNLQTVFTSHNTYLASNELMRPDCYFVIKNGKMKSFKESTSRELREGNNLEKLLRSGEFDD